MITRIVVAALLLAGGCSLAAAQSAPKPTPPPAGNTADAPNAQKAVIPPAARSGEKGLPGVATGDPIEIKRQK
jgi:hypothetical protein